MKRMMGQLICGCVAGTYLTRFFRRLVPLIDPERFAPVVPRVQRLGGTTWLLEVHIDRVMGDFDHLMLQSWSVVEEDFPVSENDVSDG